MSLRLKLLALGLATLGLPWAGCRYAREMEAALREGEQTSLQAVAQTIAASLQGRTDLLYREALRPAESTQDAPAPQASGADGARSAPEWTAPGPYDLRPLALSSAPLIDGYPDDWPREPAAWRYFSHDAQHHFGILSGVFERMLYVLLEVHDERALFDAPGSNWLDPATFGDRVWIGYEDNHGEQQQLFLAATGPGALSARRIEAGDFGEQRVIIEPRVRAAWQGMSGGYRVEIRVPLSMLGERFGVLVDDRDARGGAPVSYGTLRSEDLRTLGRLIVAAPELTSYLAQFMQPGLKLAIRAPDGQMLARADALAQARMLTAGTPLLARLYRRFIDRPGAPSLIEARAPIYARDSRAQIAALEVTQTPDRWLRLRDRALTRMLNFTLGTSVVAVLLMFAFAAWLALRLARLRRASESALTRTGLVTAFPDTTARDELGDVARSFSTLLGRLNAYTDYLRTLAGKLAHEIRTPLTIVRSSLENLEAEPVDEAARTYLARARQGSERLNAILIAMGAASRVEEAIGSAERVDFDLVALLDSAVAAYRTAFPSRAFAMELPAGPIMLHGAPDLIVQLLDKLIDNAVDFSPGGATITVRLRLELVGAFIEVDNPGPPLPVHLQGRLFESLWQSRPDRDSRPHFGLGLYIVRLIAEFHGGEATAVSLAGESGVRVSVRLPR
ncbi:MAG TPA: ATP-binding protein [Steroidobacteraceae bacterium]|jgi:signal transduction histidine kinase|nr:ATP-binding protein [Steroidobacteraceae bacterium]